MRGQPYLTLILSFSQDWEKGPTGEVRALKKLLLAPLGRGWVRGLYLTLILSFSQNWEKGPAGEVRNLFVGRSVLGRHVVARGIGYKFSIRSKCFSSFSSVCSKSVKR